MLIQRHEHIIVEGRKIATNEFGKCVDSTGEHPSILFTGIAIYCVEPQSSLTTSVPNYTFFVHFPRRAPAMMQRQLLRHACRTCSLKHNPVGE